MNQKIYDLKFKNKIDPPTAKAVMAGRGFTLIEIVVVVAVMGLLLVAILNVITATFKSQNLTKSNTKIMTNGNWILSELKKNVLNSRSITCISSAEIDLTSSNNELTRIICANNGGKLQISSNSAQLTSNEINVISCANFVTCTTLPSLEIGSVQFNFRIGATTAGVGATKNFSLDVTVRN